MKQNYSRRYFLCIVLAVVVFSGVIFGFLGVKNFTASAETVSSFSETVYTANDRLQNRDGSLSNETIKEFAKDTKSKNEGQEINNLTKVIPVEFVRFNENGYTHQYNGEEYGFFVNHRSIGSDTKLVDVALIDFTYEYIDAVCSIKIDLILQVTLNYNLDNGNESWAINEKAKRDYYVTNPRFLSILQNENALNYGDIGYSKDTDDGLIIYQTRLNYSGIQVIRDGITSEEGEALIKGVLSAVVGNAIGAIPGVGTVFGIVLDISELVGDFANALDYKTVRVPSNRESDLFQNQSKTAQKNNAAPSYSRLMAVAPQEEILLTDDSDSYFKCYTLLNDTNYRSRFIQALQFDIVQTIKDKPNSNRTYMNELDSEGNKIP